MKLFSIILLVVLNINMSTAQMTGTIKYAETSKLDIQGIEGIDIGDMLPSEMSHNKDLKFANMISVYKDADDNVSDDIEMESDDGSFKMVIGTSTSEEILYTDLKSKQVLNQTAFMSKEFLIEKKLNKLKWKLTDERIKYLGYVCQKATFVETVESMAYLDDTDEPKERTIVAWFTTEIPVPVGPRSYNQLPGAILMVSIDDGKTEIKATKVSLEAIDEEALAKPSKGMKVTTEEYEKIMAEKIKEMQEMHSGRGETIMIRG